MDRPDGTILISEDFMHVYLVQGITKSIGQMFLKKMNKEVEKKNNNSIMKIVPSSYSELEFHRPTVNVRMIATLLPWQGKIAYDGLGVIDSSKVTTDQRILIALKRAFINAVDKEKIIYSLKKNDQTLYIPSTKFSSSQLNISYTTQANIDTLRNMMYITTTTGVNNIYDDKNLFVFRRDGYTEKTNPLHEVTVIYKTRPLGVKFTTQLIPNIEEYIHLLIEACISLKSKKPSIILIDAIEQVSLLSHLLQPTNILVHWYPPPSYEESIVNDMTNPSPIPKQLFQSNGGCGSCHKMLCDDGSLLQKCSRCCNELYCCVDHQKKHWKYHKKICKPTTMVVKQQPSSSSSVPSSSSSSSSSSVPSSPYSSSS